MKLGNLGGRAAILLLLLGQPALAFFSHDHCLGVVNTHLAMEGASPTVRAFIERGLLPVVGSRLLFSPEPRACSHEGGCTRIFYRTEDGREVSITVRESSEHLLPQVRQTADEVVFTVPPGFNYDTWHMRNEFIQSSLIGMEVHPHWTNERGRRTRDDFNEPHIIPKRVQREGAIAAIESQKQGAKEFLYVAPTGTGKTEVLKQVLEHQILHSGKKIHVLIADRALLVDQLKGDAENLAASLREKHGKDVRVLHWGGENGASAPDWARFQKEYMDPNDPRPIIIATTDKSFESFIMKFVGKKEFRDKFRSEIGSLFFDEAHHAGSPTAQTIINRLRNHEDNEIFLMGMTATPFRQDMDHFPDIFGRHAFWAYIDDAETYLRAGQPIFRSNRTIIEQYTRAIEAGELTPVDHVYNLEAKKHFGVEPDDLFVHEDGRGKKFHLNPKWHATIAARLMPIFTKHKKGFVTCASVEEANSMAVSLNLNRFGKKFAVMHTGLGRDGKPIDNSEVLRRFRGGPDVKPEDRIDFLVTVGMLDEGLNIPELTLHVDLNKHTGRRQALQRMGRLLRLNPGKTGVDIVTLREFDEDTLADDLDLFTALQRGDFQGPQRRRGGGGGRTREPEALPPGIHHAWSDSPFSEENYQRAVQDFLAAGHDMFTRRRSSRKELAQLDALEKYVNDSRGRIPSVDSALYLELLQLEANGTLEKHGSEFLKESMARAKGDPDRATAHSAYQYWNANRKFPDINDASPATAAMARNFRSLLRRESEFFAVFENQDFVNRAHAHYELTRRFRAPKSFPHETPEQALEAADAARAVTKAMRGLQIVPTSDIAQVHYKYRRSEAYRKAAGENLRHVIDLEEMDPKVYWMNEAKTFFELYGHLPAPEGKMEIDESDMSEMLDFYVRRHPELMQDSENPDFRLALQQRLELINADRGATTTPPAN